MPALETAPTIDVVFADFSRLSSAPSDQALRRFLLALHQLEVELSDRLGRLPRFEFAEYAALKLLRVLLQGAGDGVEVHFRRLDDLPVHSDVNQCALLLRKDLDAALNRVPSPDRGEARRADLAAFRTWGQVVDVYPSLWNCMVKLLQTLNVKHFVGTGSAYLRFKAQFEQREAGHLPQFVSGPYAVAESPATEGVTMADVLEFAYLSAAGADERQRHIPKWEAAER